MKWTSNMRTNGLPLALAMASLLASAGLYPSFVIGIGFWSNGRRGGLICLLIGAVCAWAGFLLQRKPRWLRWLLLMPTVVFATHALIRELMLHAFTQGHFLR